MKVGKNTKITDILKEYPWLKEELPKIDDRLKILNNPMAKVMIGKKTVADVSEKAGISVDEILDKLDEVIKAHKPKLFYTSPLSRIPPDARWLRTAASPSMIWR